MPRDYRENKKYDINKIYSDELESKEWMGRRLSFLWSMRDHYKEDYLSNDLAMEKEEFYNINDPEVYNIATDDYNSIITRMYENIDIRAEYERLEYLKNTNRQEFLLKKNMNMYEYIVNNYDREDYLVDIDY